jgi:hypothetical protein
MARDFETLMKDVKGMHEALMAKTPVLKNNLGRCAKP